MKVEELLCSADRALAREKPIAERIEEIETFVTAFSAWYAQQEVELRAGTARAQKQQLRMLLEKHQRIMDDVQALLKDTSAEMRKLRERARVIVAYGGAALSGGRGGKKAI